MKFNMQQDFELHAQIEATSTLARNFYLKLHYLNFILSWTS